MAQCSGERIGRIRLWRIAEFEQEAYHMLHLRFLGGTGADHGLLNLPGRILENLQTSTGCRNNRRASGMSKLQCGCGVSRHEHLFDRQFRWPIEGNYLVDAAIYLTKAAS